MIFKNLFSLEGKNVIITGGYGHLGRAIVVGLVSYDARVFVLGRNKTKFESAFNSEFLNSGKLEFVECDIEYSEQIYKSISYVINNYNKIDVLINNAMYLKGQNPEEITDKEWEYSIDGCLNSVYRCIREVIPYMKKQNSGKIINMSSMYGMVAPDLKIYNNYPQYLNPPHYGAAKAGIIQLTKYYASYLGKFNIKVNTITPGPFPSLAVQKQKGFIEELNNKTLLNRIGVPEDLQGAFIFLASDSSNYITGQNIIIDGGWTAI